MRSEVKEKAETIDFLKRKTVGLCEMFSESKKEIEDLKTQRRVLAVGWKDTRKHLRAIKDEAIKEFAERLKEKAKANEWNGTVCGIDIDNLVKEMTEGV